MVNENNDAIDLVHTAKNNEAETATREEIAAELHYQRAWDNVHCYTDGTNVSAEEFRAAFRAEFPWFAPETTKSFRLERKGKVMWVVLRQIPGVDEMLTAGSLVRHGPGGRWAVREVRE